MRTAVITGVGRRAGIGHAIAQRLAARGIHLMLAHYDAHDAAQPWGADDADAVRASIESVAAPGVRLADWSGDLAEPTAPQQLIDAAVAEFGHLDILICNHARSGGDGPLWQMTAELLDGHWATNARSSLLLAKAFAAQYRGEQAEGIPPGGRVVFFTSGQQLGPMPGEVAYSSSKAAIAGITLTIADELIDAGITVNAVNPGPVDTGYADDEARRQVAQKFPLGRWGEPDDPARLVEFLTGDDGRWITGQVLNTEGGFARWR